MCIIIIKEGKNVIKDEILLKSATINPHGLGITWLDTYKTEYSLSSNWGVLQTDRPFIAHFRFATIGKVCLDNNHPFRIGDTGSLLYQNGSVLNLGSLDMTDTQHMANILYNTSPEYWTDVLEMTDCRWVTVNTQAKSFEVFNEEMFIEQDNVSYSKQNVLDGELVAVYGTLKRNHGNNRVLGMSKFVSSGETVNKYPMTIAGIPFVHPRKGEGHNVMVEVFMVTKETLEGSIDSLEGHPSNYNRKKTLIKLEDGNYVTAWLYFYPHYHGDTGVYHKEFSSPRLGSEWGNTLYVDDVEDDLTHWHNSKPDDSLFSEVLDGACCDKCGHFDTKWDDYSQELFCSHCGGYTTSQDIVIETGKPKLDI